MEIEFRKAKTDDIPAINELLDHWLEIDSNIASRDLLFKKRWHNSEDYFGIVAFTNAKIVGFLGVFFSDRIIENRNEKVASLTSFFILPECRCQKLTYKMVQYLKSIDDYIIYAITPIAGTFNVYLQNGFKAIDNKRFVYKKSILHSRKTENSVILTSNFESIERNLDNLNQQIFQDHKSFNCSHFYFEIDGKGLYIITKTETYNLGQLIGRKYFYYFSKLLSFLIKRNIASNLITMDEIYYCSNPSLLNAHWTLFLKKYFNFTKKKFLSVSTHVSNSSKKQLKFKFSKNSQFYYSKNELAPKDLDFLYSEIFVLHS